MAPPAASSEGIAAQSDLGDTDDTSSSFLEPAIDMDRIKPRREMLSHTARSALEPRREALTTGGIAGVVIGIVLIVALAFICAYPFVIRRLRKGKRNAAANRLDTETAFAPGPVGPPGQAPPTGPGAGSQMSSKDSFGHKTDTLRGPERQSTKDIAIPSQNGVDQPHSVDMIGQQQRNYTGDGSTYPPSVTTRRGTEQSFGIDRATTWKSEASFRWTPPGVELIATRADGMEYSDASHGHSATYYSPTIPSEAFGMVTPPPTDEPQSRVPPPRRSSSRGSSLKLNLFGILRRMSIKDSVPARTKGHPGQSQSVLREGLSDSPTELNGPSTRELGPGRSRQLDSPIAMPSPVSEGEADQAQELEAKKITKQKESPPFMPPPCAGPGTVNPMDIMAPSNATEHNWHTNQQLYQIAHPPPEPTGAAQKQSEDQQPSQAPSPSDINLPSSTAEHTTYQTYQAANPTNGPINIIQKQPTEPQPSQAPTPQSPERPFEYQQQALQQRQKQERQQQQMYQQYEQQQQVLQQQQQQNWQQAGLVNGTPVSYVNGYPTSNHQNPANTNHAVIQDVRMHDVSPRVDPTHLMPDRPNHRYSLEGEMTDPSDHSPQMPGHASSGASYQTTPNTQIDSSPSPRSDGSSDIRNSTSPYPGFQQSPRSFMCDECGRFFDQVHKLNHHKRYHERPHECTHPGCGKRFGTKTHLDRHINDKHKKTKKFHCTVSTCPYSKAGGKSFPRKDNWRRHMVNIHQVTPIGEPEPDLVDEVMGGT